MSAEQKMFEANFSNNGTFSKKKLTPFLVSDILETEIDKKTVEENRQIAESIKVNSMCANYEHHSHCNKRNKSLRKARTAFTDCQLQTLEKTFERQQYLSVQDRIEIANKLHLSDTQVKTWYQNRRTKWKRQTAVGLELLAEASNFNAFQRLLLSNPYYWSTYANVCNAPVGAYSRGYCAMEPDHFSCPNQADRTSTSHNCSADSKY